MVDAVLLDSDHALSNLLDPSHASLYSVDGLTKVSAPWCLRGVFDMWPDDPAEEGFMNDLREVVV